jgi:DNA helicase-2/ATP-dependent DNA helicase PcrA
MSTPQNPLKNQAKSGSKAPLNPDQLLAAMASPQAPLLIVAGAGTGKTRTLTSRIGHFLQIARTKGDPGRICAITFTNKAAREMEERLGRLGGGHFIGTFHALGARILRKNAGLLGRTPDFSIFDDRDSFALVRKLLKDMGLGAARGRGKTGTGTKKESPALMRNRISERKNSPQGGAAKGSKKENKEDVFENLFLNYERSLRAANAFDFDDLLHKVVVILSKEPRIREKYQNWFQHVLVDEYQDVNPIQNELVKILTSGGASLSVVGDAEQTIYGWRGSDIGIFLRFPEDWRGANMVTLTQNYRSSGNILRAAGGVIAQNEYDTKIERAVDLWTENPPGEPVTLCETFDEDSEAEWIADRVAANPATETAVLYRTNAQSRAVEQALLRRRVPYRVYGGLKFYERREIKDIIAALRCALNPNDELSRDRLDKAFPQKTRRAVDEGFREAPAGAPPAALIETFLDSADYIDYLERNTTNPRERVENIEELLRFAAGFDRTARFLEEVALLQSADELGNNGRAKKNENVKVGLMTIHLAKGLEFDRVFVAGCTEGILPHARSMETEEELQEERRLMYVAMTRARKELFLSFYGIPSRFLGEIPEDALRFENAESQDAEDPFPLDNEERHITLD